MFGYWRNIRCNKTVKRYQNKNRDDQTLIADVFKVWQQEGYHGKMNKEAIAQKIMKKIIDIPQEELIW